MVGKFVVMMTANNLADLDRDGVLKLMMPVMNNCYQPQFVELNQLLFFLPQDIIALRSLTEKVEEVQTRKLISQHQVVVGTNGSD